MEKFKPAIKYGVIMGVINLVVFLLVWAFAPEMFASMQWGLTQVALLFLAVPIVMLILAARDTKVNFKFFSYANAFLSAFYTGLIASVIWLVFNVLFVTVVDPGFDDRIKDMVMDNTHELLEDNASLDEAEVEKIMERTEKRFEKNKGLAGKFKGFVFGLIWYAILSLIIAAVYRDKFKQEEYS